MVERREVYVIPGGQEPLVRRMVSPSLPSGWRFVRASISADEVEARYHRAGDGVHASMVLSRDVGDVAASRFAVRFLSSRGDEGVRALRSCLVASVRAAESEFVWAPASPPRPPPADEVSTRFDPPPAPVPEGDPRTPAWRPPEAESSPWRPRGDEPSWRDQAPDVVDPVADFFALREVLRDRDEVPPLARSALRRALRAAEHGRRARAERSLARAASVAPSSLRVALVASVARFTLRAYRASLATLDAFVAGDPPPAARLVASAARASLLRRLGWYHESLAALDDAIARFPDEASLHVSAALLRGTLHDTAGAEAHLRAALALDPASADIPLRASQLLASAGDVDGARAWLALALPRVASPTPALLADVASHAMAVGDYAEAESLRRRVLSVSPGDVPSRLALGTLDAWRGDVAGARAHADAVLAAHPDHFAGRRLRGASRMLDGDVAGALDDFTAAVALAPSDPESAVWRAEALLRLGDPESALVEAQRGAERSDDGSDYVAAQLVRCLALTKVGRFPGMPDHVLRPAVDALCGSATSPQGTVARMERALAALRGNRSPTLTRVGDDGALLRVATEVSPRVPAKRALWRFVATADVAAALREFERVRAAYPGAAEPSNYEGELHLYAGAYADAGLCFARALDRYGRSRWAFIGLTAVAVLEGRCDDALDVMRRCVEASGPPGPTAYVYRGEAYRRLGQRDAARSDLEHAVRAHPTRVGAWVNLGLLQLEAGEASAVDTVRRLRGLAPAFVADALDELGLDDDAWPAPTTWGPLLAHMLHMLRGNRGSSCVTYFTRDGRLRTAPAESPASLDAPALLARVRASLTP